MLCDWCVLKSDVVRLVCVQVRCCVTGVYSGLMLCDWCVFRCHPPTRSRTAVIASCRHSRRRTASCRRVATPTSTSSTRTRSTTRPGTSRPCRPSTTRAASAATGASKTVQSSHDVRKLLFLTRLPVMLRCNSSRYRVHHLNVNRTIIVSCRYAGWCNFAP